MDLTNISINALQRCNYKPAEDVDSYTSKIITVPWGQKYSHYYRLASRKMLNLDGERTLVSSIIPPNVGHIDGIVGLAFRDYSNLTSLAGAFASIPFDFLVKTLKKTNLHFDTLGALPMVSNVFQPAISCRALLLNCLTNYYEELYSNTFNPTFVDETWSKQDYRLKPEKFTSLKEKWTHDTPLKTDYERRQALIEIDVLVSMALGISLEQLKTIYNLQFPVLQSYESDTWYDANGRITFTNNRGLNGVGFSRNEWENGIKDAPAGKKFYRTIMDETMSGESIERTVEYVAPFDRCNREQDYNVAWKFFEKKYINDIC